MYHNVNEDILLQRILSRILIGWVALSALCCSCGDSNTREAARRRGANHDNVQDIIVPCDLNNAFAELDRILLDDVRNRIMTNNQRNITQYRAVLGMQLRYNWKLAWSNSLVGLFNNYGVYDADDISCILVDLYWEYLNGATVADSRISQYARYYQYMRSNNISGYLLNTNIVLESPTGFIFRVPEK